MPFTRPTLDQLKSRAAGDIQSALAGSDALLRFGNLPALAKAVAGAANGQYGYLDWIARQAVPFTSTDEFLEAWAALKGVTRKTATAAAGSVAFATTGPTIPAGTGLTRSDSLAYVTTADAVVVGAVAAAAVTCVTTGAAGNCDAGTQFTLSSPVAGVTSTGAASAAVTGGADLELDDSLLSRMLQAYGELPQGGSTGDYVRWALQVAGVTRAWPLRQGMGPGTVVVYFMMDVAEAAHGGFPQGTNGVAAAEDLVVTYATGDQLAVANHIFPLQPAVGIVYATAPQANNVAFTLAHTGGWSTALKASVQAAVAAVLVGLGDPTGATVDLSYVEAAIGAIAGTAGFVITAVTCDHGVISDAPFGNITSNVGYLPVLVTPITWA